MSRFVEILYIDKNAVNVQKLMRVLEILARPGERAGDLRAQALVYTAIAGAYALDGQPVTVEWIEKTLLFSRSRVSGAVTALHQKDLIDRDYRPGAGKGRYFVYWPRSGPMTARQHKAH